jgi:hypothetical protein
VRRSLAIFAIVASAGSVAGAVALLACSDAAVSPTISPVTGIIIRSEQLVIGKGCGLGATQIYKYAAIVINGDNVPVAGATYDCFADGTFVNLAATDGGSFSFKVAIAAFNASAYNAQSSAIEAAANRADLGGLARLRATWTTDCVASQQQDIEVLAVCGPLTVPVAGPTQASATIQLLTESFVTTDGGLAKCGAYDTVRAVAMFNGQSVDAGAVLCPAPLVVDPAVAPADYMLQVNVAAGDAAAGSTTCRGQTSPGLPSTPSCLPLR